MQRKKKMGMVTFIVIISIFLIYFSIGKLDTTSISPIIDSSNIEQLPKNFRMCNSYIKDDVVQDLIGLSDLNISGSGQFSENSLNLMKKEIDSNSIIIVDLKQEDHGFINGTPISWVNKKNTSNKGLTKEQILDNENNKLSSIENNKEISIQNQKLIPTKVQNENELVENKGMSYIRIPVTDKEKPSNDTVDYFVQFVQSLPQNTWVHFHCEEGLGRTTTFMVMYDIMKNAKRVNLDDIMTRQVLIGGQDLLDAKVNISTNAKERTEFIKKFYKYASQNDDNFKITWSKWLKN
ncbi:hypothetical protein psyc5s11_21350 [Clostridium gelidum]|uniref:Tyrosine specific protein phosphatases domain-containing protein n=1 Tax=Clostridium gelidum TaxID=704125 RepID=A0ABM7T2C3_9CLOT|nr:phosphatase [Clostridium gelidum]BCZ46068.1 hypothetical protein psyc5s11_21350 [Clostridium gelidum]